MFVAVKVSGSNPVTSTRYMVPPVSVIRMVFSFSVAIAFGANPRAAAEVRLARRSPVAESMTL